MPEIDPPAKQRPAGFEEAVFFECGCNFQGFEATDTLVFEACGRGDGCPNYQFFMAECERQGKIVESYSVAEGLIVSPDGDAL